MKNYQILNIKVNQLKIDTSYQRDLDHNRAKKISEIFDWNLFSPITVAKRHDGSFYVVDGQHRVSSLLLLNYNNEVPCHVISVSDISEEEDIFFRLNTTNASKKYNKHEAGAAPVKLKPYDIWRIGVKTGKDSFVGLNRVFEQYGLSVVRSVAQGQHKCVSDTGTYLDKYISNKQKFLEAMDFIASTWNNKECAWDAQILHGVMEFITNLTEVEIAKAHKKLINKEPKYIIIAANQIRSNQAKKRQARYYIKDVLTIETKIAHNYGKQNSTGV